MTATNWKLIAHVIPPGHTSQNGQLTLAETANSFQCWARNLRVQLDFTTGSRSRLRSNYATTSTYTAMEHGTQIELCKICHKRKGHARDCPMREKDQTSRKDKMDAYSRKLKKNNEDGKPCKWYMNYRPLPLSEGLPNAAR